MAGCLRMICCLPFRQFLLGGSIFTSRGFVCHDVVVYSVVRSVYMPPLPERPTFDPLLTLHLCSRNERLRWGNSAISVRQHLLLRSIVALFIAIPIV